MEKMVFTRDETEFMRRAIELADRGRFGVHPNPRVGAVVVRGGEIIGEGYHARFGGPHAEVEALRAAGEGARGAEIYVTLEPCRHYGKTPPCTKALIEAGVARVTFGARDPHVEVSGGGAEELRAARIDVRTGLLAAECERLIRTFTKRVRLGMPWVTLKSAMTLDGKVATHSGASRWITSKDSRRIVHEKRAQVDAILTGLGTVLADDPMLNVRLEGERDLRSPHRIVLDPEGRLPSDCRMVQSAGRQRTTLVISNRLPKDRRKRFVEQGLDLLPLPCRANVFDWEDLLRWCGGRPMNEVLIEAGPNLVGGAFDARIVDSVMVFIAPKVIGGEKAPGVVGGLGVETMEQAARLVNVTIQPAGPDFLYEADVEYPE